MKFPRKAFLALCLWAAASFAAPAFAQAPQPSAPEQTAPQPAKPAKPKAAAKPAPKQLLDINTASEEELRALKGIGDVRAAEIVKNRPYKSKNELVQRKIIPKSLYDQIKDKIIAKQQ